MSLEDTLFHLIIDVILQLTSDSNRKYVQHQFILTNFYMCRSVIAFFLSHELVLSFMLINFQVYLFADLSKLVKTSFIAVCVLLIVSISSSNANI